MDKAGERRRAQPLTRGGWPVLLFGLLSGHGDMCPALAGGPQRRFMSLGLAHQVGEGSHG